jgi:hypothetical protein
MLGVWCTSCCMEDHQGGLPCRGCDMEASSQGRGHVIVELDCSQLLRESKAKGVWFKALANGCEIALLDVRYSQTLANYRQGKGHQPACFFQNECEGKRAAVRFWP